MNLINPIELKKSIALNEILETNKTLEEIIDGQPIIDAIPFDSGYITQIRWERDIALEQLADTGCGLGENMTDIKEKLKSSNKEFVHSRGHWEALTNCSNTGVYCSNCHKKVFKIEMYYANVKIKVNKRLSIFLLTLKRW